MLNEEMKEKLRTVFADPEPKKAATGRRKPWIIIIAFYLLLGAALFTAGMAWDSVGSPLRPWRTNPQLAGGAWTIWVQTPPCENAARNMHVDYPKRAGEPLIVMCDALPVPVKQSPVRNQGPQQ